MIHTRKKFREVRPILHWDNFPVDVVKIPRLEVFGMHGTQVLPSIPSLLSRVVPWFHLRKYLPSDPPLDFLPRWSTEMDLVRLDGFGFHQDGLERILLCQHHPSR